MAAPHRLPFAAPSASPACPAAASPPREDEPDTLAAIRARILGEIEAALRADDAAIACAHVKLATLYVRAYAAQAEAEREAPGTDRSD